MEAKTFFFSMKASQLCLEEMIFRACSGRSMLCVLVGCDGGRGISVSGDGGLRRVFLVRVGSC